MAGIAGALYVPQVGIINPSEFAPGNSIEAVIWVAVGGRGTLVRRGDRRGAGQLRARPTSPARCREIWLFALGALFVVVTLFLPRGIVGTVAALDRAAPRPRSARCRGRRRRSRCRRNRRDGSAAPRALLYLDGVTVSLRRLQGAEQAVARASSRARCARSSARTAPARRR